MICFIDVDEVLVNFCLGASKVHCWDLAEIIKVWPNHIWKMQDVVGISDKDFWARISAAGPEFWTGLEEFPWVTELIDLVDKHFDEWYIVTAPNHSCSNSFIGKLQWVKNMFGDDFDNFLITPHKELLAGPDRVLIDDRPRNVAAFRNGVGDMRGGQAVLFPCWGNPRSWFRMTNPMPIVTSEIIACVDIYQSRRKETLSGDTSGESSAIVRHRGTA